MLLAPDDPDAPIAKELVTHPAVGIVDFTGSNAFGQWVRDNARGKQVYTEEAGVNSIVIDSTSSFKGMCNNIAFSLSLYSGQMCTAPQNIYVPRAGIDSDEGHKSLDDVTRGIAGAVEKLVGAPERAAAILGTIQNPATLARVEAVRAKGKVVLAPKPWQPPGTTGARAITADDPRRRCRRPGRRRADRGRAVRADQFHRRDRLGSRRHRQGGTASRGTRARSQPASIRPTRRCWRRRPTPSPRPASVCPAT